MRMTEKGQVTIPRDIRAAAGFQPSSELAFVFEAGRVIVSKEFKSAAADKRPALRAAAARARAHMKPEFKTMSSSDIMAFIRPL
jgi:bifunctional DNA-binding transcriptional regulator/antitoxin component of YhaV-PrlF toxin-antitoxin module